MPNNVACQCERSPGLERRKGDEPRRLWREGLAPAVCEARLRRELKVLSLESRRTATASGCWMLV